MFTSRVIPGFSRYKISEDGIITRLVNSRAFKAGTHPIVTIDDDGYPRSKLIRDDGKKCWMGLHQYVALAYLGPKPSPLHEVAHNNGNRSDPHFENLRWDTRKGNDADCQNHGTARKGVRNGRATFEEFEVLEIRALTGMSLREIAEMYQTTITSLANIRNRKTWKHI